MSLMTLERREPRNENVYDNGNPCERGLRNDFRPILDGVPRFGPPQDPNITMKKRYYDITMKKRVRAIRFFHSSEKTEKTEKTEMGYTFITAVDT